MKKFRIPIWTRSALFLFLTNITHAQKLECIQILDSRIISQNKSAQQTKANGINRSRIGPRFHQNEFPNLFLSKNLRDRPTQKFSAIESKQLEREVESLQNLTEAALRAIFERLTLPIKTSNGRRSVERIFPILKRQIKIVDTTAHIRPSGGVVRSALGLLYKILYDESLAQPQRKPSEILRNISQFNHSIFDSNGNISADTIRGVGSDFDILLMTDHPDRFQNLQDTIHRTVTGTPENRVGVRYNNYEKSIFTLGDIKPDFSLNETPSQTQRSVLQGGSTLDFLSFDLTTGKFIQPPQYPNIVRDFFMGSITYAHPTGQREDPDSTTLRGLRPYLELPFDTSPTPSDQDILDLNRLMSIYKYGANKYAIIGSYEVTGFIHRKFIKGELYRVSGRPIPSNHVVYPVIKRNREQGLAEIIAAMGEAREEHSWVYIPSKLLWVDTTLAVDERNVYQDVWLLKALHERYGSIEIFHTHPENLTSAINLERNFPFSHLISGALPTAGDLSALIGYAWNWRRDIPFYAGVIHPLGVTYYLPTHDLLKSGAGPGLIDIGNIGVGIKNIAHLDDVSAIKLLVQMQEDLNRIEQYDDEVENLKGFRIEFFSIEEFSKINDRLQENSAALSTDEANYYLRR